MYKQEQIKPYEGTGEKGKLVEEMFDNIAPTYDTLNHRLSWDIDKGWRKKAIKRLAPFSPKKMLDIATGTGDFAILSAQMLHPDKLVGADISQGMMEKQPRRQVQNDTLKWVFSEVLRDFREKNRCYIKYEVKQGCFHITVR
jgi:ubiquinone/menaquinone biosynthesis C-methylase UbiE